LPTEFIPYVFTLSFSFHKPTPHVVSIYTGVTLKKQIAILTAHPDGIAVTLAADFEGCLIRSIWGSSAEKLIIYKNAFLSET
jgi:hypothetical protein